MTRRRFYFTLLLISGTLIGLIMGYYAINSTEESRGIIGLALVENEIPPPEIFPLFTKPITILLVLIIVFWFAIIGIVKDRVNSFGYSKRMLVRLLFLIASIASFYEVLFNFMLWSSLLTMGMIQDHASSFNPDTAVNVFPTDRYPVNMVFATKIAVVIFGCSMYALVTFWIGKKEDADLPRGPTYP